MELVKIMVLNGSNECSTFNKFIPGAAKQSSLWNGSNSVTRTADSLETDGYGSWRTYLAHQIN